MTFTPIDALGMVGTVLNVWGNLLLARQALNGWWVRIVCNVVWITHAIIRPDVSVLTNAIVFLWINAYGIWKWRKISKTRNVLRFEPKRRGAH